MANGQLTYFEPQEIEDAIYDLLDMNMIDEAENLARYGIHLYPGNELVESILIWICLHNHKAEEAEEMFRKYENREEDWALRLRFSFQVLHGHPRLALDNFLSLLKQDIVTPPDWINTIEEMFDALPNEVLAPYLVKAAEWLSENDGKWEAETFGRLGALLIDTGHHVEAIMPLEKSLDIDAYDIYGWQDLTRCYMLTGNTEKCLEACDYGLAIDDKNPLLSFIKGYMLYEQAKYEECITYFLNARSFAEGKIGMRNLNMTDSEIQQQVNVTYEMLGISYMETEKTEEAKECFEILIERNPEAPQAYIHLANLYLLQGDLNKAQEYAEHAVLIDPKEEAASSLRISILLSMQKVPEAIKAIGEALKLHPKKACYLIVYAELLRQSGQTEKADKYYRKMLKQGTKVKYHWQLLYDYFTSIGDQDAIKKLEQNPPKEE